MKNDDYIDERGLASYFEAQWLDKLREIGYHEILQSKSKLVPDRFIESSFFREVSNFIGDCCIEAELIPENMLEIGPSLGRVCYDLIKQNASLKEVSVVEPSRRLLSHFEKIIINGGEYRFPYIVSVNHLAWLRFDTTLIAQACEHIKFQCINEPFVSDTVSDCYDLTVCLNVLDQCESPSAIVQALHQATKSGGIVVLSCSYQWSKKHLNDFNEAIDDINDYFNTGWQKIGESELDYKFRFNERYALLFLSHVVVYKKS